MAIKWLECEITERTTWTKNLSSIKFRGNVPAYTAGQFTKVGLEIAGDIVSRPYSYVSVPTDDFLEIVYVTVPGGYLTPELDKLKTGDKIYVMDKASGFFVMNEVPDGKNLWMIATGTGLGVFISLLKSKDPWEKFENIILIHGVRESAELIYTEQISNFKKNNPKNFQYISSVTREIKEGSLNERITQSIKNGTLEKMTDININKDSQFMVCGNPDMINEILKLLGNNYGLERNRRSKPGNITLEKYW